MGQFWTGRVRQVVCRHCSPTPYPVRGYRQMRHGEASYISNHNYTQLYPIRYGLYTSICTHAMHISAHTRNYLTILGVCTITYTHAISMYAQMHAHTISTSSVYKHVVQLMATGKYIRLR